MGVHGNCSRRLKHRPRRPRIALSKSGVGPARVMKTMPLKWVQVSEICADDRLAGCCQDCCQRVRRVCIFTTTFCAKYLI